MIKTVRSCLRWCLLVPLLAVALLAGATPAAADITPSVQPAPTARFIGNCGFAPACVVLSRTETNNLADGGPALVITIIATGCGAFPTPGNIVCAVAGGLTGAGMALMARYARGRGECVGIAVDVVWKRVVPFATRCIEE